MENVDQQSVEQGASVNALRVHLGELLSRERLSQQKDVTDVARRLMLSKLQLLAIETGESASFHHERRYIQGIKSYVFYLGLQSRAEVNELVSQIEGDSAESLQASPAAGVAQLHRSSAAPAAVTSYISRGPRFIYYGLGLLLVGAITLVIILGWNSKDDQQATMSAERSQSGETSSLASPLAIPQVAPGASNVSSNRSAVTGASSVESKAATIAAQSPNMISPQVGVPVVEQSSAEANKPESEKIASAKTTIPAVNQKGQALMRIDFNAECWVSLQTAEGKKEDRIYKSGESLSVPLASVTGLILGNAPAAKVFMAGRQVDVMGKGRANGNVTRLDQKGIQLLQKN